MEQLKSEFDTIKKDVEGVMSDIKKILYILTGTEYEKGQGLLDRFSNETIKNITMIEKVDKRVEKTENRLEKLEKWKDRIFWIGLGMAFPAGYGIIDIIHIFFGKK